MRQYRSYFRKEIDAMSGYTPGEQPKMQRLIKLNTNENPYPPSPKVIEGLATLDGERLRRYPDPLADRFCALAAKQFGVSRNMVIAANGSDDILTMAFRGFTSEAHPVACLEPTYSLYHVLAKMQNAPVIKIGLNPLDFSLPEQFLEQAKGANLLIITRPNAPTGNSFPMAAMRRIAENFDGVLLIDEAYADFAGDNCMDFVHEYPNVIVSRTMSKSYSLAGMRLGFAIGHPELIGGLYKLKDSYNVDMIAQIVAENALLDQDYLMQNCEKIRATREETACALRKLGFKVIPSQTNFLFASPPDGDGERYFKMLRENAIIVRYFPGPVTGAYVRITIGTPEEMAQVLEITRQSCRD